MYPTISISKDLRNKLEVEHAKLTANELDELTEAYYDVTKATTGRGRVLKPSCPACIPPAIKVVSNYLKSYQPREATQERSTKVKFVGIDQKPDEKRSLPELREKYPHIRSTSKKGFLDQIK
jgi:hypothetical protein